MNSERYSRQILFPGIGPQGQERIAASQITVIGCGALGSVSCEMLVRAGVGGLRIVDRDYVEETNLQRQSLFTEADVAQSIPKAVAAARALSAINSKVVVQGVIEDLTPRNVDELCRDSNLIVDGTDNFETRFLLNDYAVKNETAWVYGAAVSSYGISLAIVPGRTACLRCLFDEAPPAGTADTCDTAGILAPVVHCIAAYQVAQALKLLVGQDTSGALLQVDVWKNEWRVIEVGQPAGVCPCCSGREFPYLEGRQGFRSTRLCGRGAVQISPPLEGVIDLSELAGRAAKIAEVQQTEFVVRIKVQGRELTVFQDGRAIIKGTDDPAEARSLYAKYIGH